LLDCKVTGPADSTIGSFVGAFERIQQFDSRRPFAPRFFKLVLGDARRVAKRRARLGSRLRE
jgi:hypothetical protein